MSETQEKLWEYEAVQPGQQGAPTIVTLTAEHIAAYADVAQNPDPRYNAAGGSDEYDGALVAMPTTVLTYAPLLREEIAERQGFVALEESKSARRQTPFAKCEIRWFRPVLAGDTLTGTRRVFEKYERRGSRFVTFRVEASNQRGEHVALYDYTCIFSYARGQRDVPPAQGTGQPATPDASPAAASPVDGRLLTFDTISVGDRLASVALSESQEIMLRKNELRLAGKPKPSNIHTDEAFARRNIFGGVVNSGPATMSVRGPDAAALVSTARVLRWRPAPHARDHAVQGRRHGHVCGRGHRQTRRGREEARRMPRSRHESVGRAGVPLRRDDGDAAMRCTLRGAAHRSRHFNQSLKASVGAKMAVGES